MTTIKIKIETQRRLREFADGIGGQYDNVLTFLLDTLKSEGEPDVLTGARYRDQFKVKFPKHKKQKSG